MSEPPQGFWKKGIRGTVAWFVILGFGSFFLLFAFGGMVFDSSALSDRLLFAAVGAIILALLGTAAVAFFRWVRYWRNLRVVLFGMVCVATLIALAYAEENWRGKHAWERHVRALEARGEKVKLADFVPPAVPDSLNFAITPLFKMVLDYEQGPRGTVWRDTNALHRLEEISAELEMPRATNAHPSLGNIEKGTFGQITDWAQFYLGNTNYPQAGPDAAPAEVVFTALNKFTPEIKELQDATATRPYSRFPIHYSSEPPWAILLPHLSRIRVFTTLTQARALADLELGLSTNAFEELRLGLRLADSIRDEPFLIDHLVRLASLAIDLQTVREGLVRHAWSSVQLSDLEVYLAKIDLLGDYEHAMQAERACSVSGLDYLRRERFHVNIMDYLASDSGEAGSTTSWSLMPSGWYYQNMLTLSRMHERFTFRAVDIGAHRAFPDISDEAMRTFESMPNGPLDRFAKLLLPAVSKAVIKFARMQTSVDCARVACALERYRQEHGQLPPDLSVLRPQFIQTIPNDVIAGAPLRYVPQPDGGYILYSVGWNKTDDGGKVVMSRKSEKSVDATAGDWVWQIPAKQ